MLRCTAHLIGHVFVCVSLFVSQIQSFARVTLQKQPTMTQVCLIRMLVCRQTIVNVNILLFFYCFFTVFEYFVSCLKKTLCYFLQVLDKLHSVLSQPTPSCSDQELEEVIKGFGASKNPQQQQQRSSQYCCSHVMAPLTLGLSLSLSLAGTIEMTNQAHTRQERAPAEEEREEDETKFEKMEDAEEAAEVEEDVIDKGKEENEEDVDGMEEEAEEDEEQEKEVKTREELQGPQVSQEVLKSKPKKKKRKNKVDMLAMLLGAIELKDKPVYSFSAFQPPQKQVSHYSAGNNPSLLQCTAGLSCGVHRL